MIKKIYFYDGNIDLDCLENPTLDDLPNSQGMYTLILDGRDGFSREFNEATNYKNNLEPWVLVTNNPLLLRTSFLNNLEIDNIYLYNFKEKKFKTIQSFTNKELNLNNDFTSMWIQGAFKESYKPIEENDY